MPPTEKTAAVELRRHGHRKRPPLRPTPGSAAGLPVGRQLLERTWWHRKLSPSAVSTQPPLLPWGCPAWSR
jgi:hypothetical protein